MLERQVTCEDKGIEVVELESDDAWARDVAPTFVKNADGIVRGINWSFNAWGGDYDGLYADWTKDNLVAKRFLEYAGFDCYDAEPFVLEGGSIHSDGDGTMLVTESCLCSPGRNPKLGKAQIEEKLKQYCNVERWYGFRAGYIRMRPTSMSIMYVLLCVRVRSCSRGRTRRTTHSMR